MSRPPLAALVVCTAFAVVDAQPQAKPVLWRDPGPMAEKDLRWGAGTEDRRPQPPFTFVKEDLSGSKPKVRVTDARGVEWNVKFAGAQPEKNEVNAEVAANRIAWALGYFAEEDYYLAEGRIEGAANLGRSAASVGRDGTFHTARFERRDPHVVRTKQRWTLDANPFAGTRELSGLEMLLALVNNWDNKPENTSIDTVKSDEGSLEDRYLFSDWGASFGRMAGPPSWSPAPTRWNPAHYEMQPLTSGVDGAVLKLNYLGQIAMPSVPLDHARWFGGLASQLREEQVRAAFTAAGASDGDAQRFAARLIEKIKELTGAVQSSAH